MYGVDKEKLAYSKSEVFTQHLDRKDFESLLTGIAVIENLQKRKEHKRKEVERKKMQEEMAIDAESFKQEAEQVLTDISLSTIIFLASPLLIDTTFKIIKPSFIDNKESLFSSVYYAGIAGIEKGVNKYDSSMDTGSSVHYIVRWFKTYARREVERTEADMMGVSFSKLVRLKKIAGIRMQLEREKDRKVDNGELLSFINTGQAEPRNKGKLVKDMKVTKENKNTTIEDIIEQERVYMAYFLSNSEQSQ